MSRALKGRLSPMKGKCHTKEAKSKMSLAKVGITSNMKGRKHTEETKEKLRQIALKQFKNGMSEKTKIKIKENAQNNPNFGMRGRHHSNESTKKMSETKKILYSSGKVIPYWTNKKRSEGDRKKISISKIGKYKGKNSFFYGKEQTFEHRKKSSAKKQGISLDKWEKFIHFEPYTLDFNDKFKRTIRERDNQVCMNCGIHREKLKRALDIHHVNYDKKLSIPQNCISLCLSCHLLTQINREYWTKLFQEKLNRLYNYQYSETGEIILNLEKNG